MVQDLRVIFNWIWSGIRIEEECVKDNSQVLVFFFFLIYCEIQ